ncbi:11458_t:CDS:1, partial [Entrophospora sp. SA101]
LREDNLSPCPSFPRAKTFLSEQEANRLMGIVRAVIKEEKENISKSAESFLKALLLSDLTSIRLIAKECGARGIVGLCNILRASAETMQVN